MYNKEEEKPSEPEKLWQKTMDLRLIRSPWYDYPLLQQREVAYVGTALEEKWVYILTINE